MIQLRNISHSYNGHHVLADVSFSISEGECVGLTGPSGCGKSTLAQIVAGHVMPSSGRVVVDERDKTGTPSRDVILIHQESDLFPWLAVEKQIRFAMKRNDPRNVEKLIALTKLSGFGRHYPNELSGGMKKRLALARALAVAPKLLILDESFSALDADMKQALHRELKEIWEATKTTILLITHDSRDIQRLAQREIKMTTALPTTVSEIIPLGD